MQVPHNGRLPMSSDSILSSGPSPATSTMKLLIRPLFGLAALWALTILAGCGSEPKSASGASGPAAGQSAGSKLFGVTVQTLP